MVRTKSLRSARQKDAGSKPMRLCLDVRFRLCERRDLRLLEWEGIFAAHRRIIAAVFRKQERGEQVMWIAEANGMPVGQVWIDFNTYQKERFAFLWAMRVVPWFRRLGIGHQLLAQAETIALKHRCVAIQLTVIERNAGAVKLYKRSGFEVVGRVPQYEPYTTRAGRVIKLFRPLLVMRKDLVTGNPQGGKLEAGPRGAARRRTR
jgi:ribosomal protein S18 acetylase RimI-like enzyme